MATKTTVETWAKTNATQQDVQNEQKARLAAGAVSSTITEDANDWILTTVWTVAQ